MAGIFKKFENTFSKKTTEIDTTEMWFLTCPESDIEADASLDAESKSMLMALRRDGFCILRANLDAALCDAVVADFNRYCANHPLSQKYRDDHGLHSRLALFHYQSRNALKVALAARTQKIVRAAFRADNTIVGSLFFEKGSTQDIHRDTPAFFTNPLNHFLGVWNALEDIRENSGELCYYIGGHKVVPDAELCANPEIGINNYFEVVEQACKQAGLDRHLFLPEKGDTLIWLPQLPHGGAMRINPALPRRSIVFHFIPNGIPLHGANDFFNHRRQLSVNENYSVKMIDGVRAIDMGETRFYHNHSAGNFTER